MCNIMLLHIRDRNTTNGVDYVAQEFKLELKMLHFKWKYQW